jgi:hypothetical protein
MRRIILRKDKGLVINSVAMLFMDDENPMENAIIRVVAGKSPDIGYAKASPSIAQLIGVLFEEFPYVIQLDFWTFCRLNNIPRHTFLIDGWEDVKIEVETPDMQLKMLLGLAGVESVNAPIWTPELAITKAIVVAEFEDQWRVNKIRKIVRFGTWNEPNNQSDAARSDFYARNQKYIQRGKSNPAYWCWYYLWAPGTTPWSPGQCRPSGAMVKGSRI